MAPRFSLDLGTRVESQEVSGAFRVAPRAGLAWNPIPGQGTTVRGGFGFFYDRVPLNVYVFNKYPDQLITYYDADGNISGGAVPLPEYPGPGEGQAPVHFSGADRRQLLAAQHQLDHADRAAGGALPETADRIHAKPVGWPGDPQPGGARPGDEPGAHLLSGTGGSRYRQFEVSARFRVGETRQLMFSYIRSKGRGDLNDFGSFLGTFPQAIVRPNQFGNSPADLPNRFLTWGLVQLPWKFRVAPVIEYRSGFPYVVTNAEQDYVGVPNSRRFPRFLSVDSRVSKDFQVHPQYAVQLGGKRFQSNQPLQSGGRASECGGSGFWLLLRPPGPPFYARLRCSFLIALGAVRAAP